MRSDDLRLAENLARGAGDILLSIRRRDGAATTGRSGDQHSNRYLLDALARERPDDAVLSEEAADDLSRLTAERVWIIDPLDGTREFAEQNEDGTWRTDFAVHVALWTRSNGLAAGVVGLPARDLVYRSDQPPLDSTIAMMADEQPLRVAVSRSRPPQLVNQIARHLPVEFAPMGSAGVKVMAVVSGEADAYIHGGGQYEWDSAAPVAVALGAGLHASRLDGSPLIYNRRDPWLPDLLVCRKQAAPKLLALLTQLEGTR